MNGFSGAEVAAVCDQAAYSSIRATILKSNGNEIKKEDLVITNENIIKVITELRKGHE